MALSVTATVTRADLGLSPLNINDHSNYSLSPSVFGGSSTWERNRVSSPWVDGEITVSRRRATVTDTFVINVYGSNQADMLANIQELVQAFSQNSYHLTLTMNGTVYQYMCEAADYTVEWGYKMHSNQTTVTFQVPRKPQPSNGGV